MLDEKAQKLDEEGAIDPAALARMARKYDEAEPLLVNARDAWTRELGEEHEKTLVAAAQLAFVLAATGRLEEAEPLFRATYDTRKKTLGEEHSDTAEVGQ